jgi:hypothetical protein
MRRAAAISRAMRAVLLEGAALGHVEDDLELRLVVEGQHLDLHRADADEAHRADGGSGDDDREENPAPGRPCRAAGHDALVEPGEGVLGDGVRRRIRFRRRAGHRREGRGTGGGVRLSMAAQDADAAHGVTMNAIEQREEHRRARADRDRAHVGAHQAADEGHRQNGGDDGPGGEDGGVADLVHGLDGDLERRLRRQLGRPCGGRCFRRRRSRRPRGCRSRRSARRA